MIGSPQPDVSVIVASHRRAYIEQCVSCFGGRTFGTLRAEIFVVADYALEGLPARYPFVQWLFLDDRSIPAKRNMAARQAKGEILAFIDDDCRPEALWAVNAVAFLRAHPQCAAVEGHTTIEVGGAAGPAYSQFKRLEQPGFRTNNIFYRKDAFLEAGLFDERFTVQREDLDLAFTVLSAGREIGHCPEVRVSHVFRPHEKWDLLKNCMNRRFDPLLHHKHQRLYRRYVKSPFTPAIAGLLALHACVAAVFLVEPMIAGLAVGADILAVTLLTIRRAGGFQIAAVQWVREFVSCAAAPMVLLGALVYGSIRFRSLLLW